MENKLTAGLQSHIRTLEESGLVDETWYLERYKDAVILNLGAAEHYLRIGAELLRDPSPAFNTAYYVTANPDVADSGMNPLLHYIHYGRMEGRRCVPAASSDRIRSPFMTLAGAEKARKGLILLDSLAGLKSKNPARKTVLVCAHAAGQKLFGGERSLLDVVDGLSALSYNVIVTMPSAGNADYVQALRERSIEVLFFRYGWWRKGIPLNEHVVAMFARIIAGHAVDAVHANTILLREPLVAAKRMGIPSVAHVRELITHDVALCETIGEEPQAIVAKVLDSADWIVANSEATADCFAKPGSTLVVRNTIEADSFDIAPPVSSDTIRVALISSNLPKKGILDFVQVAQLLETRLPNVQFVLIGPDNDHTRLLKQRQAAGELPPNIVFAGYRHSPIEAMEEADIVLNLSHFQESFGRTVLEAMSARRPVVVYAWGALPELVQEGETGFIVPFRNVAAVAGRLEELCRDSVRIRTMGEAARMRALMLYAKPHYIQSLQAAYDRVFMSTA
jgi:glycosyltransferase involved in cell wall biosynthesis